MNSAKNILLSSLALGGLLSAGTVFSADVEWQGWSFDYTTNENSSGLVIKNVDFNGKRVMSKASMPVMRVEYDRDVCGPYADIMSSSRLSPANAGAPDSACDGLSVCRRTFTQDGQEMLEVGANWQIGEYQIYQTYYFSAQGYIDSRVYSRGLQCQVDHRHHAHWMFDFDIGDANNDRIIRGADQPQAVEFNGLTADTSYWTVEDIVSGEEIRLVPSVDDGAPDDFSEWDMAGRAYKSAEVGRWRLGARGEIGDNYMTPAENIDGKDIVVWYVSHLPHSSSEGSSIWHASGPRIEVVDEIIDPDPGPDPDPDPDEQSLLANGGFESGLAGWVSCGAVNNLQISEAAHDGTSALGINGGGCLYQEVPAMADEDYALTCQATRSGSHWTIMELSFLDSNYNLLGSDIKQIAADAEYSSHSASATAPANTAYALALFYSEDDTRFDSCVLTGGELIEEQPPVDQGDNILSNGGFESELNSWTSCASTDLSAIVADAANGDAALSVTGGGCMYQEFAITEGSNYSMRCSAKRNTATQYTSVSLTLMDASYRALQNDEQSVSATAFTDYSAALSAPAGSKYGSVVVYSEDTAVFDDCSVTVE